MGVALLIAALIAGFAQCVAIALVLFAAFHQSIGMVALVAVLIGAGLAAFVAYGHLVFIALLYRRLLRQGRNLKVPRAVGRVLSKLLDGLGYAI